MKKLVLNIILLSSLSLCYDRPTKAQCHNEDWTALKALYESTNGDNWINKTGWEEVTAYTPSANCNLESLFGVGLDGVGRVSCIDLNDDNCNTTGGYRGNNLTGSIPPEIGNLTNLTYLEFRKTK